MSKPVTYEVNLNVDKALEAEYATWLRKHINDMLMLPGFISANCFRVNEPVMTGQVSWSVHYQLENQAALEQYFIEHADRMRADGVQHFGQRFNASRRVLEDAND